MAPRPITVTLVDGARVVVPDSLALMTPYVLQEQHDWFEDEIKFVRALLEPGDRAIDIGANYGVYTVSMARAVGPTGRVWAFEPAAHPATFLELSVAENGYTNVVVERSALSDAPGDARLAVEEQSELNALAEAASAARSTESVRVTTLDERLQSEGWSRIDFVKIDAEGAEAKIVVGGSRFFDTLSPLVQYEVRNGADFTADALEAFAALGYRSYRLVPALGLLAPFDAAAASRPTLLNLFACRREREEKLARRKLLARSAPAVDERDRGALSPLRRALGEFRRALTGASRRDRALAAGLEMHRLSRDTAASPDERLAALHASVDALGRASAARATPLRLSSFARAALDFGSWDAAVNTLTTLAQQLFALRELAADEPFLAPSPRFDTVERHGPLRDWLLAATLDAIGRASSYSSFFDSGAAKARLETIEALGYSDDDVRLRLRLIDGRTAAAAA